MVRDLSRWSRERDDVRQHEGEEYEQEFVESRQSCLRRTVLVVVDDGQDRLEKVIRCESGRSQCCDPEQFDGPHTTIATVTTPRYPIWGETRSLVVTCKRPPSPPVSGTAALNWLMRTAAINMMGKTKATGFSTSTISEKLAWTRYMCCTTGNRRIAVTI